MADLITLDEAREYIRMTGTGGDTILAILIDAAEQWALRYCGVDLTRTTRTEYYDGGVTHFRLRWRPVASITSVTDVWTGDDYDSDSYSVMDDRLHYQPTGTPPSTWPKGDNRHKVIYVAGYDATEDPVPGGLKLGILDLIDRLYRYRGGGRSTKEFFDKLNKGEVVTRLDEFRKGEWI